MVMYNSDDWPSFHIAAIDAFFALPPADLRAFVLYLLSSIPHFVPKRKWALKPCIVFLSHVTRTVNPNEESPDAPPSSDPVPPAGHGLW